MIWPLAHDTKKILQTELKVLIELWDLNNEYVYKRKHV